MNKITTDELRTLFEFVPPERIKCHITNLYFYYLQGDAIDVESSKDFKEMAGDIQFLLRFFEKAINFK
jgi:hypothetical protein